MGTEQMINHTISKQVDTNIYAELEA